MFGFKSKKIKGHEQAFYDWYTKSMDYPEEAMELLFDNHYSYQFYFCGGIYLLGRDLESDFKSDEKLWKWKYDQIKAVSRGLSEAERTKLKLFFQGELEASEKEAKNYHAGAIHMGMYITNIPRNPESYKGFSKLLQEDLKELKNA